MNSGVEDSLIKTASEKSGKDVGKDMTLIHNALRRALTTIAWHGEEGGAQQAKWFMDKMAKAAKEYSARTKPTHREAVLGALKSLSHARTIDHRDVYSPNYEAIARAVLQKKRARPDFEAQVAKLAGRLPRDLDPYLTDNGYRPDVDLDTVAQEACKAGGVDLYNTFKAAAKMRDRRLREKLGTQPVRRGRGARRT
ncbi:hypothetical protein [Sorangium sp. So ce426]|uniref:hypothetical protein n=1 Tax=Sorangium sp. So ce426 TaxID=3133312 RepID=UPI003F5CA3B6